MKLLSEIEETQILESIKNSDMQIEIEKTKQLEIQEKLKLLELNKRLGKNKSIQIEKTKQCLDCSNLIEINLPFFYFRINILFNIFI